MILALFLLSFGLANAAAQTTGSVVITAVDGNGDAAPSTCFVVFENVGGNQGRYAGEGCDPNDGTADGVTTITNLAPGNYLVVFFASAQGYVVGTTQQATVVTGQSTPLTFVMAFGGSTVVVSKVDEVDNPLPGACFNVTRDRGDGRVGDFLTGNCSDPARNDGVVLIPEVLPGNYVLLETQAPAGYTAGAEIPFAIVASQGNLEITVENAPASLVEQLVAVLIEILRNILGR
jgi:uncharacterized surface anchored protein